MQNSWIYEFNNYDIRTFAMEGACHFAAVTGFIIPVPYHVIASLQLNRRSALEF